jgi:hypothetical protein
MNDFIAMMVLKFNFNCLILVLDRLNQYFDFENFDPGSYFRVIYLINDFYSNVIEDVLDDFEVIKAIQLNFVM